MVYTCFFMDNDCVSFPVFDEIQLHKYSVFLNIVKDFIQSNMKKKTLFDSLTFD